MASTFFAQPLLFPTQSIHLRLPEACVLVDACRHDQAPDPLLLPPGYHPPDDLLTQLTARDLAPQAITHVVITHAHFDHYAQVTREERGEWVSCFPQARYLLSQAEWERADLQHALQTPGSPERRTLGVLFQQGMLDLIQGPLELTPGVQVIPAPGETPGHQVVRVHDQGHTLYCLGDLYHHPLEYEHPTWMVRWGDHAAKRESRSRLMQAALAEQGWLVAAHIPPGRLVQAGTTLTWTAMYH